MTAEKDSQSTADQTWAEVGRQFRSLGDSLAAAFKSSWESEETRQHLEKMQAEIEAMATEVARSTRQAVESEEGHKIKVEVENAAESVRAAGQQTAEELQPHLLNAFRQIRSELDQIINRMEETGEKDAPPSD